MRKLKSVLLVVAITFTTSVYSQKFDITGSKKGSKVYYKDGTTEVGKLKYDEKRLSIKFEDKTKKEININKVEKFVVYKKKDSIEYTYVLSEKNYKKKKKQKYLCMIAYESENVNVYNEPTTAGTIGALSISQAVFYIQKKDAKYAEKLMKPYVHMHKRLKEYFSDCPSLVEKIGTEFKYKKFESLIPMLEYYNTNCNETLIE